MVHNFYIVNVLVDLRILIILIKNWIMNMIKSSKVDIGLGVCQSYIKPRRLRGS